MRRGLRRLDTSNFLHLDLGPSRLWMHLKRAAEFPLLPRSVIKCDFFFYDWLSWDLMIWLELDGPIHLNLLIIGLHGGLRLFKYRSGKWECSDITWFRSWAMFCKLYQMSNFLSASASFCFRRASRLIPMAHILGRAATSVFLVPPILLKLLVKEPPHLTIIHKNWGYFQFRTVL